MGNRTVIITGASRGIGKATAELFSRKNWNVVINYCSAEKKAHDLLDYLARVGEGKKRLFQADVSCRSQVDNMVDFCLAHFGSIDVLVNNAGIAEQKPFAEISEADWDRMMNVNLKGAFNCCQAVLSPMLRQQHGKIINVASIWGMVGASCEVHYSAAKAGLIGLTKALAKELAPSNIQVNCVCPGIIQTDMLGHLSADELTDLCEKTPLGRLGSVHDVAHAIYFLASDEAAFFTGQVLSPNGGFVI